MSHPNPLYDPLDNWEHEIEADERWTARNQRWHARWKRRNEERDQYQAEQDMERAREADRRLAKWNEFLGDK